MGRKIDPRVFCGERTAAFFFDGMSWPYPLEGLSHRLRYGGFTPEDARAAAGILDAYTQMIRDPVSKRQNVIANIRHGLARLEQAGKEEG